MEFIQLPLKLMESKDFNSLTWIHQKFLIGLYSRFHDTNRFTIDCKNPVEYYQGKGVCNSTMAHRISVLLDGGFLIADGEMKGNRGRKRRVFKFKEWN